MRSPSTAPAAGLASALQSDTACSLALAAAVAASARDDAHAGEAGSSASIDAGNDRATFDWFAAQTFSAAATPADLDDLRTVYDDSFQPLALAVALLTKSSDEMAETAGAMLDGGPARLIESTLESMAATRKWLAESGEVIRSAEVRLLAGMCRSYKAKGGRVVDYALCGAADIAPAPDAVLIALGAEMDRREATLIDMRVVVFADVDEKNAAAWAAYRAADDAQEAFIRDRIAPLRATTQGGTAVKARALAYLHHAESFLIDHLAGTTAGALLASLAQDVAPVAAPAPHPDAALIANGRTWMGIQAEWDRPGEESDVVMDDRNERESAVISAIAAQPATTFAGLAVKARILAREAEWSGPDVMDDAALLAWAATRLTEKVYLDRIVASLLIDLLRPADAPRSTTAQAA